MDCLSPLVSWPIDTTPPPSWESAPETYLGLKCGHNKINCTPELSDYHWVGFRDGLAQLLQLQQHIACFWH